MVAEERWLHNYVGSTLYAILNHAIENTANQNIGKLL